MNNNDLKQLIRECIFELYGNDANISHSIVSNWLETLQTSKVYNIEQSLDKKQIKIKLVDGGVAELQSNSPIEMKPIVHKN